MPRLSFLTCPHHNVQQFTEMCLDCNFNIYASVTEYLESLRSQVDAKRRQEAQQEAIEGIKALEDELGIKRS